jgi:hypothetical protein
MEVLDAFSEKAKIKKAAVNTIVKEIFIAGNQHFTLQMNSAQGKQKCLTAVPTMSVGGRNYIAHEDAYDIYRYKPQSVKLNIYGAPPTMKDEVLLNFISRHADIVGKMERGTIGVPYEKVIDHSTRIVTITNIKSAAGIPMHAWFNDNRVRFRHRGQVHDREERNSTLQTEWKERQERPKQTIDETQTQVPINVEMKETAPSAKEMETPHDHGMTEENETTSAPTPKERDDDNTKDEMDTGMNKRSPKQIRKRKIKKSTFFIR